MLFENSAPDLFCFAVIMSLTFLGRLSTRVLSMAVKICVYSYHAMKDVVTVPKKSQRCSEGTFNFLVLYLQPKQSLSLSSLLYAQQVIINFYLGPVCSIYLLLVLPMLRRVAGNQWTREGNRNT